MNHDFSTKFTGWSFLAAALMMWGGWMLIPVPVGPYMQEADFGVVEANRMLFVWSYRTFFFGAVFTVVAIVALASLLSMSKARAVVWPGATVAAGGMFSVALGCAYYYHHGYWGSLALEGQGTDAIVQYIQSIRMDGEYVTCLMRFGRLFGGLGILIYSVGLVKWRPVPVWLGWIGILMGFAAIAVIMPSGENFKVFAPVFHLQSLWLALMGAMILRKGVRLD